MCRLMAYIGHPMLVADCVLWPDRSIIKQSYDAKERKQDPSLPMHLGFGNLNGDGFGIGWFSSEDRREVDPSPCVFTGITPAWNNENLARLARKIISPVIFAHVRAAYPGMPVSEQNCHPFQWGRYLWMHNGVVGGFTQIRRSLLGVLSDVAYNSIQSFHSDSAVSFAVFLHHLPDSRTPQPPDVLLKAMNDTLATISRVQQQHGITAVSLLNFVVSDGSTMVATRYAYPEHEAPASLYYAEGSGFQRVNGTETCPKNTFVSPPAASSSGRPPISSSAQPMAISSRSPGMAIGSASLKVPNLGSYPESPGLEELNAAQPDTPSSVHSSGPAAANCNACAAGGTASGSSILQESSYKIAYGERGSTVAFIASEPITGSKTDWVAVPPNHVLVFTREKSGYLNVMRTPINPLASSDGPQQQEVSRCLEAISRGLTAKARTFKMLRTKPEALKEEEEEEAGDSLMTLLQRTMSAEVSLMVQEDHRLTGHTGPVLSLAYDELQHRLYTAGLDCTIKVWRLEDAICLATLAGHNKPVAQLDLRDRYLYSAAGGVVRVWSTETFKCVHIIKTSVYSGAIRSMALSPEGHIYVGNQDTSIKLYKVPSEASGSSSRSSSSNSATTTDVAAARLSKDSSRSSVINSMNGRRGSLYATSADVGAEVLLDSDDVTYDQVQVADCTTLPSNGHVGCVNALVLCGKYVCSAAGDAMVRVWSTDDLQLVRVLRGHRGSVLCLLAVGNLLLSGARDNLIRVWDLDMDFMCKRTLTGHQDDVVHLSAVTMKRRYATAGDGNFSSARYSQAAGQALVVSASADGSVRVWSSSWTCLRIFTTPMSRGGPMQAPGDMPGSPSWRYTAAALSSTATRTHAIAGYADGMVRLWPIEDLYTAAAQHSFPSEVIMHQSSDDLRSALARSMSGAELHGRSCAHDLPGCSCHGSSDMELVKALREFVGMRTVSIDKKLRDECYRGAKFLLRLLESLGADVKMARCSEEQNPLVLARLGHDPARPTVTFYGHYDVQPASEPEWRTNPFELVAVDGHLYGRGTSDNKGPILAFIYAVKEMMDCYTAAGKSMPVNVAFVLEGEEEHGSLGFRKTLEQNLRWLEDTSLVVISNTLWVGESVPCLTYGMRGMIALSIEVSGPERDVHSGNDGGVFEEPMADLVKLLATLVDTRGRILVPGFYKNVRPRLMDRAWEGLEHSDEFSLDGYQAALGVPKLTAPPNKRELLETRWCKPSLSIVDMRVGPGSGSNGSTNEHFNCFRFGPTRFSVIPSTAVGKISVRFVPEQDAAHLITCLREHVEAQFQRLGSHNSVRVKVEHLGDRWEADPESQLFKMAEAAIRKEWGMDPLYVREGGTMPVASLIEKTLGAPVMMIPMGQSSDNCHLANERIRRANLVKGKNVVRHLLEEVAEALGPS